MRACFPNKKTGYQDFHTVNKDWKAVPATNVLSMYRHDSKNTHDYRVSGYYHQVPKGLECVESRKIRKETGQCNHTSCCIGASIRADVVNHTNNVTICNADR